MNLKNFKQAFTLAEIVIVMIIIAVVVSVSLKLAKTKLDNIRSYTYFAAYQTLHTVSREMLYNFRSRDNNYIAGITDYALLNCDEGQQPQFIGEGDTCVVSPATVPRDGAHFCELFVGYTNTQTNGFDDGLECRGNAFAGDINGDINFSGTRADAILKNGMRIYNLRTNPQEIRALDNNSFGRTYRNTDSTPIDMDTTGYTVFIDTDGSSGPSVLWQDIFPFYITMSGKVIPAYRGDIGGSNKEYLSAGASNEFLSEAGRRYNWYAKNVSYKEAACVSGFIRAATPYCSTEPAVVTTPACTEANSNCTIQVFPPIRFFN